VDDCPLLRGGESAQLRELIFGILPALYARVSLVEQIYPLVAEGINNGLFIPNRASTLCSYCPYKAECAKEFGGAVE
jgi:hypothetical protein